jgi:hypothetical protein
LVIFDLVWTWFLVPTDWFVGISLYKNIEEGLDNGTIVIVIVIVPIIPSGNPTRWKCLLVDEPKKRALTALTSRQLFSDCLTRI